LVVVQEDEGAGALNRTITRAERYDEAGNSLSFDGHEGVVVGSFGDRYICPTTGNVWHMRRGDTDTGWERGTPPEEEDQGTVID
jgi:hypothetical protein